MYSKNISPTPFPFKRILAYASVIAIVGIPTSMALGLVSEHGFWSKFGLLTLMGSLMLSFAHEMATAFESYVSPGSPPPLMPKQKENA